MKLEFFNKTIFIISPERWGVMRLSKHHYAVALAERGNRVFFIEPPSLNNTGIKISACEDHPDIRIISYKPVYRGKRFLPAFIFNWLIRWQIRKICRAANVVPDIVWSFEPYRFENLKWFNASLSIFHPVDLFSYDFLPAEAYSADFCFCFSSFLTDMVKKGGRPTYFINHGLNKFFCTKAEQMLFNKEKSSATGDRKIKVGYIGNLRIMGNDRVTMQKVIAENPGIDFLFWGQYEKSKGNLGSFSDPEVDNFIAFLEACENVKLKGPLHPSQLSEAVMEADMFWLCLDIQKDKTCTEGVNSHKILEYLATGKPFVSHYISDYRDTNLFYMLLEKNNDKYSQLFDEVVEKIRQGESEDVIEARLKFALDNSYSRQIDKIENIINGKDELKILQKKTLSAIIC